MRYLSVCSGIEAASVAWHHLGWEPVGFSEIEPFPAAVLAHRFPHVPNYGDMTKFEEWPIEPGTVDLLVGGTPCQSFSVAGLRKGLEDPRGNLMLTYLAIAARLKPRWVVWENVPGVLSSNRGRDFATFLSALGQLGYGWAYRVLDAQYVRVGRWPRAVPQRRRRVFVVGRLIERGAGDWTAAAQTVLIPEGLRRHNQAGQKARKVAPSDAEGGVGGGCIFTSHEVAPCLETTSNNYSRADGFTMVAQPTEVSGTIAARFGQSRNNHEECVVQPTAGTLGNRGLRSHTELDGHGAYIPVAQPVPYDLFQITAPVNRQNRKPGDPCHTLARDNAAHAAVAFDWQSGGDSRGLDPKDTAQLQRCQTPAVHHAMTVRRLSARECERLQGFPDDWTLIPWRGKPADQCPDGPRYKALGNSMACNCMAWIGERIAEFEAAQ